MNDFINIDKNDIEPLNDLLKILDKNGFYDIDNFEENNDVNIFILTEILIVCGFAERHQHYNDDNKLIINTRDTHSALILNYFENFYNKSVEAKEQKSKEYQKLKLEIKALKKKNRLIVPAFIISVISVIIAIIALQLNLQ